MKTRIGEKQDLCLQFRVLKLSPLPPRGLAYKQELDLEVGTVGVLITLNLEWICQVFLKQTARVLWSSAGSQPVPRDHGEIYTLTESKMHMKHAFFLMIYLSISIFIYTYTYTHITVLKAYPTRTFNEKKALTSRKRKSHILLEGLGEHISRHNKVYAEDIM